jgi:hypothetical protein
MAIKRVLARFALGKWPIISAADDACDKKNGREGSPLFHVSYRIGSSPNNRYPSRATYILSALDLHDRYFDHDAFSEAAGRQLLIFSEKLQSG